MNIRKFEAATFEEALARVKAELGPDALILSSEEKRRGWFQKPTVEVTAAFEESEQKSWNHSDLERVFPHRRQKPNALHSHEPKDRPKQPRIDTVPTRAAQGQAVQSAFDIEHLVLDVGIAPETARDLSRQIVFDYPRKDRNDPAFLEMIVAKFLAANMKTLPAEVFRTRRSWAFVGPAGSGKTTVAVKLALTLKGLGQPVQLSSCDRRKIIGMHELAAYSKLIDVPFTADAHSEKKTQVVGLLDTPSLSPDQRSLFKETEKHCRDASTVVVLDATARLKVLLNTVDRFASLAPVAIAFTRLDLATEAGVVHDVLKHSRLPLLGCSTSHAFATPFRFFEPTTLARFLVAKARGDQQRNEIIESATKEGSLSATI